MMKYKRLKKKWINSNKIVHARLVILMLFITLLVVITGCDSEVSQQEVPNNPFTAVWGPGKDHVVTFSGNSIGHAPGGTSDFTLTLDNNSLDKWQGRYIVQLLDTVEIVLDIADEAFSVPAGIEKKIAVSAEFPDNLDGPYGLSLYIPDRKAQSIQTVWIGEKIGVTDGDWPSRATHPWLWPEISEYTEEEARELAEKFMKNGPTFTFDGIEDTLKLTETLYLDIENAWQFVFTFDSRHSGYGDRTGQMLAQVITPHEATIIVEKGEIVSALMDGKWDMIFQEFVAD
jgi:hypothetical protein